MSWGETLFLRKTIVGQKRFTTSNDKVLAINNSVVVANNVKTKILKFVPKISGVVKFSANYSSTVPSSDTFEIGITSSLDIDGWIQSRTISGQIGQNYVSGSVSFEQSVIKGETYYFAIKGNTVFTSQASNAKIYGDIIDAEWFKWD